MEWRVENRPPYSPKTNHVANRVTSSMSSSDLRCKGMEIFCKIQIFEGKSL